MDKVLPDERRVNFQETMGAYVEGNSSYAPGQPTLDTDRAPGRPSPNHMADTMTSNPFKTLEAQPAHYD